VAYAQYKDVGQLLPDLYDETITRRWGVDVELATPILSLQILVPSMERETPETQRMEIPTRKISSSSSSSSSGSTEQQFVEVFDVPKAPTSSSEQQIEDIRITAHEIPPPVSSGEQQEASSGEDGEERDPHIRLNLDDIEFHGNSGEEIVSPDSPEVLNPNYEGVSSTGSDEQPKGENEAVYRDRRLVKRQVEITYPSEQMQQSEQVVYRSLGSPHLAQPIKLQMWLDVDAARFGPRSNPQCVRWNSFTNQWTRLGCQTEIPDFDGDFNPAAQPAILVNCSCTHISSYAVIVDVIDPEDIPEPSLLVQITSYSAFLVSLPLLLGVLLALALLRGQQTNSNTIHQNIVLCVFCAELLFFVGMQSRRQLLESEFPCKLTAICLHYFWLAAFAWTTVDCVHLYRMLTEMRDINHGPMGFYFAMGYGAPAIVVGLSVGVRAHEYGNSLL